MLEYEQIARIFPGFSLTEIRAMSSSERKYWVEAARYRVSD